MLSNKEAEKAVWRFTTKDGNFPMPAFLNFLSRDENGTRIYRLLTVRMDDGERRRLAIFSVSPDGKVEMIHDDRPTIPDYEQVKAFVPERPTREERIEELVEILAVMCDVIDWCVDYKRSDSANNQRGVPIAASMRVRNQFGKPQAIRFAVALGEGEKKRFNSRLAPLDRRTMIVIFARHDFTKKMIAEDLLDKVTKLRRKDWRCKD